MATDYPKPDSLLVGIRGVDTPFDRIKVFSATLTPAAVANITNTDQSFTVSGIPAGAYAILVSYPAPTNNANPSGAVRVTAANTISVMYNNPTAGSLTPPSGTYKFLVFMPSTNPAL